MINSFFNIFSIIFCIMFVFVIGVFIFVFAGMITRWNKNNRSPRLTVEAEVISKRTEFSSYHHHTHTANASMNTMHNTYYYVTFQFFGGDRLELNVPGEEYGLICEGDSGKLTFQGTRYISFERL